MKSLRFWLPLPNGFEREVTILGQYVESIILCSAEHEAGHLLAAYHFGAALLSGIAVGFLPERRQDGMHVFAIYCWEGWSVETQCTVKAAGPAADVIYRGGFTEIGASGDLKDIQELTGVASLEPYLTTAKEILTGSDEQFHCIAASLRRSVETMEERTLAATRQR
jgi:hypothetical protein